MKIFTLLFSTTLLMLLGCATMPREADLQEQLKTTAENYWKLRMEGKYEDTYKMEGAQGLPPIEQYRDRALAMKKIDIRSISVKSVSLNGDKGEVDLEWTYMLPKIPKPFNQIIKDEWLFKGGKWRHAVQLR
jgi:hypothetical protein